MKFVVQKHAASRLHYDFRLEMDGVLKSWAVPKGPSMDSSVKRLAILVDDHDLEYANFEGVISEGYGAGKVLVWDNGNYECENPSEEFENGKITFELHGKKLKGKFVLLRTAKGWLLMKQPDQHSSSEDILLKDKSVLSGKKIEDISL
jgi:bifunctional non-homologous end joining protein LigD